MYISADSAKRHLNIDKEYKEDDEYIIHLITSAESAVAKRLNVQSLGVLLTDEGYLPQDVVHSCLLLIGNWYANRESVSNLSVNKLPYGFDFLADLNRNFNEPF